MAAIDVILDDPVAFVQRLPSQEYSAAIVVGHVESFKDLHPGICGTAADAAAHGQQE
jgi:hypothetical protein